MSVEAKILAAALLLQPHTLLGNQHLEPKHGHPTMSWANVQHQERANMQPGPLHQPQHMTELPQLLVRSWLQEPIQDTGPGLQVLNCRTPNAASTVAVHQQSTVPGLQTQRKSTLCKSEPWAQALCRFNSPSCMQCVYAATAHIFRLSQC
jgi:hypothetical protein